MKGALLALLLTSCTNIFQTRSVGYCMVLGEVPAKAAPFVVHPVTPTRVFAGDDQAAPDSTDTDTA